MKKNLEIFNIKIPFFLEWLFYAFLVFLGIIFFVLKLFPYSFLLGGFFLILGIILSVKSIFRDRFVEYKIYKIVRDKIKMPFIRWILAIIFIFIGLVFIILPVFPASSILGILLFSSGVIFIIKVDKLRYLIKLRRSIAYLFSGNIFKKETRIQKIKDIKKHVRQIFEEKKR